MPTRTADILDRDNFLAHDMCVCNGKHCFVRCVLELPIRGIPGQLFGYGVWSTLAKAHFDLYCKSLDDPQRGRLGPWFGWFSTSLPGYPETLNLKCQVRPQNDFLRPLLELEPTDHPLAIEQRKGLTLDWPFEIYRLNGHDLGVI